jgi:hypothetical protein
MSKYPKYRIEYLDVSVVQEKYLIPQGAYDDIIIPAKKVVSEIEALNNGKPTSKSKQLKEWLKRRFGDYFFTDQSALFKSIETGTLSCNNHTSRVKVELI